MKKKIALVHCMPLEYYPPVMNMINFLCEDAVFNLVVYSCRNIKSRKVFLNREAKIIRFPFAEKSYSSLRRLFVYLHFNFGVLIRLIFQKPDIVLYYETYSAAPVYWYRKIFNRKVRLFIHNHEYLTRSWYEKGMKTVKKYHDYEINYLYSEAEWISHTNKERLSFFEKDYPFVLDERLHCMPNYPPRSWVSDLSNQQINKSTKQQPVKVVYVGSLSFASTYIREFCDWVLKNKGKVCFDVYSYNLSDEVEVYLKNLASSNIKFFKNGIDYFDIPQNLKDYDVGVVLYKAVTSNFQFNETNKFFEYYACGLDVWFPDEMQSLYPFVTRGTYPKVIKLDFAQLHEQQLELLFNKTNLSFHRIEYFYEQAYSKLRNKMLS